MKTLSGTFAFVALAVIAIITLPSCDHKQGPKEDCPTDKKLLLKFGKEKPGTETEYVDVNKDDFDRALCNLEANGGKFDVTFLPNAPGSTPIPHYTPPYSSPCPPVSIKTDKITTSEVAANKPAEESSAYDPNVVYHVRSKNLKDIKAVLDTFKDPSPTPTPH